MKLAGLGISVFAATLAALVLFIVFTGDRDAPADQVAIVRITPTATLSVPTATPIPSTWLEALGEPPGVPPAVLVSCADANNDGFLNDDDATLGIPEGINIRLDPVACIDPEQHADFYFGAPFSQPAIECDGVTPVKIVLIPSAGSDLLQPREGESLGLIDIAKEMRAQLEARGASVSIMVAMSAIFGADPPQTSMEQWLAASLRESLDVIPCTRAVIIGHSHGGVTANAVAIALEDAYADRLLVVLIDRSFVLYDRFAPEVPLYSPVVNFFQLNEGWHGEPIDLPNVENIDESDERAPIAPSDGGGAPALVSHKTLDDALAVQQQAVAKSVAWALQ